MGFFLKNWDPKRDFSFGLLHAKHLTQLLADVEVAQVLLEQTKKCPERREIAERWIERAEPRVRYNWDLITSTGDRIVELVRRSDEEVEASQVDAAAAH